MFKYSQQENNPFQYERTVKGMAVMKALPNSSEQLRKVELK